MTQSEMKPEQMPAFPLHNGDVWGGMALRDYFAAQALASAFVRHREFGGATYQEQCRETAESCYLMADAMLKARTIPMPAPV